VVIDGVVRAAGGVVRRDAPGGVEVVVVHRPKHSDWSFPKGHLHPGEADGDAAVREVEEETGLRVSVIDDLGEVRYLTEDGPKGVRYWSMAALDDRSPFRPDDEVDEARWVGVTEAAELLTHEADRALLARVARPVL
jgi:8-oxo-dGTP diphosphatase